MSRWCAAPAPAINSKARPSSPPSACCSCCAARRRSPSPPNNRYYDYLGEPLHIFGFTFAANRVLAFAVGLRVRRSRSGSFSNAPASAPRCGRWRSIRSARELVGIDVRGLSALAFACGGALAAAAGTLVSTFLSFNPAIGIEFTMKALVVVIMGGVGNMLGGLAAGLCSASPRRCAPTTSIPD